MKRDPPAWVWVIGLALNIGWAVYAWNVHSLTFAFASGAGCYSSLNWLLDEDRIARRRRGRQGS